MAREVIIKCDICGSTHKVENRKLPMYRTFDATDGRTYYESPQIVFECIDICEECEQSALEIIVVLQVKSVMILLLKWRSGKMHSSSNSLKIALVMKYWLKLLTSLRN